MDENEIKSAIEAGTALAEIRTLDRTDTLKAHLLVVPVSYKLENLERLMNRPARTKLHLKLDELPSFIAYVKEFKTEATKIFVKSCPTGVSFEAVIDFDEPGEADWREHRVSYAAIPTPEWTRWIANSTTPMTQLEFAEFLEANQMQVVDPPGADLLEMVQTLEGKNNAKFRQVKRLSNGKQSLEYVEDIELKGSMGSQTGQIEMPAMLRLGLSPFRGGSNYAVAARLRYRIADQTISFRYELVDPHIIIRDAVQEMMAAVSKECEIEPLQGSV